MYHLKMGDLLLFQISQAQVHYTHLFRRLQSFIGHSEIENSLLLFIDLKERCKMIDELLTQAWNKYRRLKQVPSKKFWKDFLLLIQNIESEMCFVNDYTQQLENQSNQYVREIARHLDEVNARIDLAVLLFQDGRLPNVKPFAEVQI